MALSTVTGGEMVVVVAPGGTVTVPAPGVEAGPGGNAVEVRWAGPGPSVLWAMRPPAPASSKPRHRAKMTRLAARTDQGRLWRLAGVIVTVWPDSPTPSMTRTTNWPLTNDASTRPPKPSGRSSSRS